MDEFIKSFILCFIPILVAMDPIGLLPVYMNLTEGHDDQRKRKTIAAACLTGFIIAIAFMAVGQKTFDVLGITAPDFLVAGGIVLFCFALSDLMSSHSLRREPVSTDEVGAVPLGTPLMVGPGVLAASLILLKEHGFVYVGVAVASCLLIVGIAFSFAPLIIRALRPSGARAFSRIASLFLAAFAVMMVRSGITQIIRDM